MNRLPLIIATVLGTLSFLFVTPESHAQAHTKGRAVAPFTATLKPGDYAWHPELSPTGPVVVMVSLPDQVLYVYRNGVRIANSTVSSGKPGKTTPTGVFTVLQKKVRHTSSIYFLQDVRALIEPGTTLILTNAPVGSQTHSGSGFNILTADAR